MSELCGPLKPRGLGLPIKMCWELNFPISSGFGWRLCDVNPREWALCSSQRHFYGIVIQISVQRWQQLKMTSSATAEAAKEREPCYVKVKGLSPRQRVSLSSHASCRKPFALIIGASNNHTICNESWFSFCRNIVGGSLEQLCTGSIIKFHQ